MVRAKIQVEARHNMRGFTKEQIRNEWSNWWFENLILPTSRKIQEQQLFAIETYIISERMLFGTIFNYTLEEWVQATSSRLGIEPSQKFSFQNHGSVCANANYQVPTGLQTLRKPEEFDPNHHQMLSQIFEYQGIPNMVSQEAWLRFHYNLILQYSEIMAASETGEFPETPAEIQSMIDNYPHICLHPTMVAALGLPPKECRPGSTMGPPYDPRNENED